jgi:ABC-type transport system involved in multi-copper enzyme maturation permease subunit
VIYGERNIPNQLERIFTALQRRKSAEKEPMSLFQKVFKKEFNRFFKKSRCIVMAVLVLAMVVITVVGIHNAKNVLTKNRDFQRLQTRKFEKVPNYLYYSLSGINYRAVPTPFSVYFRPSGDTSGLKGKIDTLVSLDILLDLQGGALFKKPLLMILRLVFVMYFVISLLLIFLGYDTVRHKDYLIHLAGLMGYTKTYLYLVLSRIILITLFLAGVLGILLVVSFFSGVPMPLNYIGYLGAYLFCAWLVGVFTFLVGVLIGSVSKEKNALPVIVMAWFVLILLVPAILESYIVYRSKSITSNYQVEYEKLEMGNRFGKGVVNVNGNVNINDITGGRAMAEEFYSNDYKQIEQLDKNLKREFACSIDLHNKLSLCVPTTFFLLTAEEISSLGYGSYLEFFSFLIKQKRAFLRWWIDKVYIEKAEELVPFTENHLFYSHSRLPNYFLTGVIINLCLVVVFFIIGYFVSRANLFKVEAEVGSVRGVDIDLKDGETIILNSEYKGFNRRFVKEFFGMDDSFTGKITISGLPAADMTGKDFLYLPNPSAIPDDIRVPDYLGIFNKSLDLPRKEFDALWAAESRKTPAKRFGEFSLHAIARIMIEAVEISKSKTLIFNDFDSHLKKEHIEDVQSRISELGAAGSMVILIIVGNHIFMGCDTVINTFLKKGQYSVTVV